MKYKGMGYLRRKLASRKERCETRYDYYEMKNQVDGDCLQEKK